MQALEIHTLVYGIPTSVSKIFGRLTQKRFVCCAFTIQYIIYSMVGRSIANISDLGSIFSEARSAEVNMAPRVGYIGYGPPYTILYIIHMTVCVLPVYTV